jgi:glycosyltransferase involved in cell wall biosynthesis
MAYGLPVVSTTHAGIPEAVVNQETGLLVNEGDTMSMAANIVELARQPLLRTKMGKAGRLRVEKEFTWEKECNALSALLNL